MKSSYSLSSEKVINTDSGIRDRESQKNGSVVMVCMSQYSEKKPPCNSSQQSNKIHIKCIGPFWGSSSRDRGIPHTLTHLSPTDRDNITPFLN